MYLISCIEDNFGIIFRMLRNWFEIPFIILLIFCFNIHIINQGNYSLYQVMFSFTNC